MAYLGTWESTVAYVTGDQVSWEGRAYAANASTTGDEPPHTKWTLESLYLSPDDLREPSPRYPGVSVPAGVSDVTLYGFITDASSLLDRLTGDHFLPTSGVMLVDGPPTDGFGRTRKILLVPRRLRTVTEVATVGTDGTTADVVDPSNYRIHSSLTDPATTDTPVFLGAKGYDGIEFLFGPSRPGVTYPTDTWTLYYGGSFPSHARAVKVTGTFDWLNTPEPMKKATALLVKDWANTPNIPAKTARYNTGRAQVEMTLEGTTGIPEVDRIVTNYTRAPSVLTSV